MRLLLILLSTFAWAQVSRVTLYLEDLHGRPISAMAIAPKPGSAEAPT